MAKLYTSTVLLALIIAFYGFESSLAATIKLTGTVRDFWPCSKPELCGKGTPAVTCDPTKCHNDFERYNGNDLNIVQRFLGKDRKPIYNNTANHPSIYNKSTSFDMWFRDTPGWNIPFSYDIILSDAVCDGTCQPGVYGFYSNDFFPINGKGFGNYANNKNFAFTFELHTSFTYMGYEVFKFTGDDDVWVYINNTLVVDLGGVHGSASKTVVLSTALPYLQKNQTYPFDIFFAERHTSASNFQMFTSLEMTCPWYDWCGVCQGDGQTCCKCNDNINCTVDTCHVTTGQCIFTPLECSNGGNPCISSMCSTITGKCTNNTVILCDTPPDPCLYNGRCTQASGCVYDKRPNGYTCDDQNPCTQSSTCSNGVCTGSNVKTCPAPGECQTTGTCNPDNGQCEYGVKSGNTCDDGNACSTVSKCFDGFCSATTWKPNCTASDQCHVAGVCDAATGLCSNPNKADATPCNDNKKCTLDDVCTGGVCGGTPVVCNSPPQCYTGGSCNSSTGLCTYTKMATNSACDDGDPCTTVDKCNSNGVCVGSSPKTCPGPADACHVQGVCDSATGQCTQPNAADGTSCPITDLCATAANCSAGVCQSTAWKTCNSPGMCQKAGSCDASTGQCFYPPKKDGNRCNDGNECTQTDECQNGVCVGSNPVVCDKASQCKVPGTCNPDTGLCSKPNAPNNSSCSSTDNCAASSRCQDGLCVVGTFKACRPATQCEEPGVCNSETGECGFAPKAAGFGCNDGNPCTQLDQCDGAGSCKGSNPVVCQPADQCHDAGTCDPGTGVCSAPKKTDYSSCDDSNSCTIDDFCISGVCKGFSPVQCPTPAAGGCKDTGTCNPATGQCSTPNKAAGSTCDDNNLCSATSTCSGDLCLGGNFTVCAPADQCHKPGVCNGLTGSCTYEPKEDGTGCDDGNGCTQVDTCQAGVCVGSSQKTCPAPPDQCHATQVCNTATGECTSAPLTGTACNDGDACTQHDTCQEGVCVGTNPIVCPAPADECHVQGVCAPATGLCSNPNADDGTLCNDNNMCSGNSTCQAGKCNGFEWTICGAPGACHLPATCDPTDGVCHFPNNVDGTVCDDYNPCTQVDQCAAGVCVGSSEIACPSPDQCLEDGVCVPSTGLCEYPNKPYPTPCDDGNACSIKDVCLEGKCWSPDLKVCDAPAADSCLLPGVCNSTTGNCHYDVAADGSGCQLGDQCATGAACSSGKCEPTGLVACLAPSQCYADGTCDSSTGACNIPVLEIGTPCDDTNKCTWGDGCYYGTCTGVAVVCDTPPMCHVGGKCNQDNGECDYDWAPNQSSCDDGNACTTLDVCVNGTCVGTNPIVCAAPDQCHDAATCNSYTGICEYPAKNNVGCNDGDACSQTDTCIAGVCTGSNFVVCANPDQCHDQGSCDPATGSCSNPEKTPGTACLDGDLCTVSDTCAAGECAGVAKVCPEPDQCHRKTGCNSATGECLYEAIEDGTGCNDGNPCTLNDACNAGICVGAAKVCTASDQCHVAGVCDVATGICSDPEAANGTTCVDGNACSTVDICSGGVCVGLVPKVCEPSANQCAKEGVCVPETGDCTYDFKADNSPCNDNDLCSQTDVCISGTCTGTEPKQCPTPGVCRDAGVCDARTGLCSDPISADNTTCDDMNACSAQSECLAGVCVGNTFKFCPQIDQCHAPGVCVAEDASCLNPPLSGDACNDGNPCTSDDACVVGVCTGTTIENCVDGPPYILLTNVTQPIVPTQTVWLPLFFHGYVNLPYFAVTVSNLPNGGDNRYTFGYVNYPGGRDKTTLYRDLELSAGEEDYVAIKLNPPQTQLVEPIVLFIEVDYEWNGRNFTGYHTVVVPIVESVGDFDFIDLPETLATVVSGDEVGTWFPINIKTLSRVVDFKITLSSDTLQFTYPDKNKVYSSFYYDSFQQVGETDFCAVRVVAPKGTEVGTHVALINAVWMGAVEMSTSFAVSFAVVAQEEESARRDSSVVSFKKNDVNLPVGTATWVTYQINLDADVDSLDVDLSPINGLDVIYKTGSSASFGSLRAGDLVIVPIMIDATIAGDYSGVLSATYAKGGITYTVSANTKIIASSAFKILAGSLSFNTKADEVTDSISFRLAADSGSTVVANVVNLPAGIKVSSDKVNGGDDGSDDRYFVSNWTFSPSLKSGKYAAAVQIQYSSSSANEVVKKSVLVNIAGRSAVVDNEPSDSKTSNALAIGVGIAAGVAVIAVVALTVTLVVRKRKARKIGVFAEPQLQVFNRKPTL